MSRSVLLTISLVLFLPPLGSAGPIVDCLEQPDVKDQAECVWDRSPLGITTHAVARIIASPWDGSECVLERVEVHAAGKGLEYRYTLTIDLPGEDDDQYIHDTEMGAPSPRRVHEGPTGLGLGDVVRAGASIQNTFNSLDNASAGETFRCTDDAEETLDDLLP